MWVFIESEQKYNRPALRMEVGPWREAEPPCVLAPSLSGPAVKAGPWPPVVHTPSLPDEAEGRGDIVIVYPTQVSFYLKKTKNRCTYFFFVIFNGQTFVSEIFEELQMNAKESWFLRLKFFNDYDKNSIRIFGADGFS